MSRLRIRVELSRGGAGVPLHKLASVIAESQKFLSLLTEDVQIDKQPGEWLGFDFDRESLNFTAEYVGPVTAEQMEAFNAAFDGTTSLRRDTIAQFLRITEAIGEDEVIGFGLYQADDTAEPTEWRCLSRRDAWRIAEEVQILMGSGQAPHLPAVSDPSLGARMFGDRRNRSIRENRLAEYVREVESGLSTRIQRVESQVQKHSGMLQDLQVQSAATETSFRNLLSTFETFCNQATRNIERLSPAALPAAASVSAVAASALAAAPSASPAPSSGLAAAAAVPASSSAPPEGASAVPSSSVLPSGSFASPAARAETPAAKPRSFWIAAAGVAIAMVFIAGIWLWPAHDGANGGKQDRSPVTRDTPSTAPATVAAASVEVPAPRPVRPVAAATSTAPPVVRSSSAPAASGESRSGQASAALAPRSQSGPAMEIALDATEPTWVSVKDQDGKTIFAQLLDQGTSKTIRLEGGGTLRAGNAGGLAVRLNGSPIGPIGPSGGVREVAFKDGKFTIGQP